MAEKTGTGAEIKTGEADPEFRRLLRIRKTQKAAKPTFARQESWKYVRVKPSWRRPHGIDNKMRVARRGWPRLVRIGYSTPRRVRGLHPSGLELVTVHNEFDLELVNPGNQLAMIAHTVGGRKRARIIRLAKERGIVIMNPPGAKQ